jgi:hypothetical protein
VGELKVAMKAKIESVQAILRVLVSYSAQLAEQSFDHHGETMKRELIFIDNDENAIGLARERVSRTKAKGTKR